MPLRCASSKHLLRHTCCTPIHSRFSESDGVKQGKTKPPAHTHTPCPPYRGDSVQTSHKLYISELFTQSSLPHLDETQGFPREIAHPQPLHVQHRHRLPVLEVRLQNPPHVLGHEDVVPLEGLGAHAGRSYRREVDAAGQLDPHGAPVARPAMDVVRVVALDQLEVRLGLSQDLFGGCRRVAQARVDIFFPVKSSLGCIDAGVRSRWD